MDVVKILETLSAVGLIRLSRITGDYYQIYCPIHNDGNERKPSCGVLLHDVYKNHTKYPAGWTHCFSCGYVNSLPDLITDILKSKSISGTGMQWLKDNIPGFKIDYDEDSLIPSSLAKSLNSKYAINYINDIQSDNKLEYVSEEELAKYRYTVPYMYDRKLTDEIIEKYDVGVDMNWVPEGRKKPIPCITFPVRDIKGNTLFICRRSIKGKFFHYPEYVTKPLYGIYELPENCKSVLIVESCFNCLTAVKYGQPAIALLGTGNSYQIQQLKELGIKNIILGFDPDNAGARATAKIKKALKNIAMVWTYEGIPEGKDINDLSYDEFKSLQIV